MQHTSPSKMRIEEWYEGLYCDAAEGLRDNLRLLFDRECRIVDTGWRFLKTSALNGLLQEPLAGSFIEAVDQTNSRGCLFLPRRQAIWAGATLAMLGYRVIKEKIGRLELDGITLDAFAEVCNQLIGLVDRSARRLLYHPIHLRQDGTLPVLSPEEITERLQASRVSVLTYRCAVRGGSELDLTFILPDSFFKE